MKMKELDLWEIIKKILRSKFIIQDIITFFRQQDVLKLEMKK